ncbi:MULTISPECIES: Wadjet anti-phage system protein JetD domain-containing protein [Microbacterium]|uniref:Wadjet anti-phage system protein JetD domain-containing protein n=1 Tax=Microbacterium TaxID=33882 RepID=UPI001EF53741|nr:Wadjet anti-phage system protein JetD domain-containing protein [Microbacterium aurum]MCG7413460.1 DUF2220 family protein [Microbacterium aurum]
MITVAEARRIATARLSTKQSVWAAAVEAPVTGHAEPVLKIVLRPPTEKAALGDQVEAERWAREWADVDDVQPVEVEWETRSWSSIGRQRIPVRAWLPTADAVAAFAGGEPQRTWKRLSDRARAVIARLDGSEEVRAAIRKHSSDLCSFDEDRFQTVLEVSEWLVENPVRGLRPRQLPIRGVDTKWFSANRSIVTDLVCALTGRTDLGIIDAEKLIRVKILDNRVAGDGPTDFAGSAPELGRLTYRPEAVFVFENLECVLAMPEWPGAIVVHGGGHAIDVVRALPWVQSSPVVYWGDMDSHGLAILHRLRSAHTRVTSALMDVDTLLAHRDLWMKDAKPNRGTFDTLTEEERALLERLRDEGDPMMEQERIPWEVALAELRIAWRTATCRAFSPGV